jgi:hypothetical protein
MDCTYSDPVNYQGNLPSSSIESFNFATVHCSTPSAYIVITSTGSAQGTSSAVVDFSPALNNSFNVAFFVIFVFMCLALIYMYYRIAGGVYRR